MLSVEKPYTISREKTSEFRIYGRDGDDGDDNFVPMYNKNN